jgi:hypothetical protein
MPWMTPLLEPMSAKVTSAPSMLTLSSVSWIGAAHHCWRQRLGVDLQTDRQRGLRIDCCVDRLNPQPTYSRSSTCLMPCAKSGAAQ